VDDGFLAADWVSVQDLLLYSLIEAQPAGSTQTAHIASVSLPKLAVSV